MTCIHVCGEMIIHDTRDGAVAQWCWLDDVLRSFSASCEVDDVQSLIIFVGKG